MKKNTIFLCLVLFASLLFLNGNTITRAVSPSLLISEVAYDGIGTEADSEFVELYNPTTSSIDLTGWSIADNVGSFPLSGSIGPGELFTIADSSTGFQTTYGVTADMSGSTLALANSGDELSLFDGAVLIDYVAWEGYSPGWTLTASTGESLQRTTVIDTDNESDFVVEPVNPTLSTYLSGTGSGLDHLLVNEVLYDTPGTDSVEEWIEIYNPTAVSVDLSTFTISDGEATFSLFGTLNPGEYLVVARDTAGFNALYGFDPDISGMTLALSNSGDSVTLADSGITVDVVGWEGELGALVAATGEVLARQIDTDTDSDTDWDVTTSATPGSQNGGTPPGPDTESPLVSIVSPSNGATVYRSISILTSSSDNVGVTSQEITVDGSVVSTSGNYYWDTTTVLDGLHTIATTVYDAAGNSGSDSISITVDNANAPPVGNTGEVKIMSYNIENSGANPDWLEVVKEENADIVILVETGSWDDTGDDSVMLGYCDQLNSYFSGFGEDPYNCDQTMGVPYGTSGEAIFSRYPIITSNQIALLTLDDGSTHDPSHDFLDATIDVGGNTIHFIAAHLKCCGGTTNEDKRIAQQEGIINYMDNLGDVPIIYAGDLNSFSPEDTGNLGDLMYQPMSMMLEDTTYGDLSSKYSTIHTWDDPLTTIYPGQFFPSYGHQNSIYTSRIDFIVTNQHFSTSNYIDATVGDTATADTGSDHYSTDFTYNFGGTPGDTTSPSQVDGLVAIPASSSQIDLSWNAATDDTGVTGYNIYRDSSLVGSTSGLSHSDTGLTSSTSYTYTVSAFDAAGNEGIQSNSVLATTDADPDTTPPSQVTGLLATTQSDTEIDLAWSPASDNVAVDYYRIYRNGLFYTTALSTLFNDIGLTPSTTYDYQVSAVDTSGNEGALSATATATTDNPPTGSDMYVSSISITKTNIHPRNGRFDVLIEITILDETGNPISGALVTFDVQLPNGNVYQFTVGTDSNGIASIIVDPPRRASEGTFTVTVIDVNAEGYSYNPSLNVETSDSATLIRS